ncbi:MAG TPA: hypothetical protein VJR27_05370 [Candidatus Saccharimonadales bacterium]|nr:hypothetical protein [Candidatus Saccharimonadales bacterium]
MNFTNRDSSTQPSQPARNQGSTGPNIAGPINNALKSGRKKGRDWMKGGFAIMLVSLTIIVLGIVYLLHIANPNSGKYVKADKLQAVFLQNGQVYFGHIKGFGQKYLDLQGIYYLNNSNSSSSSSSKTTDNNVSLVKLGCELHGPYDEMVINTDQVTFWENLRGDGQVAQAVAKYIKDNPKGQVCSQNQSQSTTQSTGNTQNTTSPSSTNKQ